MRFHATIGAIHLRAENPYDTELLRKLEGKTLKIDKVWKDPLMKYPAIIILVDPPFETYGEFLEKQRGK